ncbi:MULTISPECIES: DUF2254 domain-containing protein [Alphaproteobacteria]|uniref:DUF2254 domain-containing protein n=2 Tax=Alphaproteobacteria TaxID=28211 RepID=A0A512HFQ4_9HYPH|nr:MULTISPECIES: DUF2254 domain-containing protein [Alphaproteobacteria]GEO84284.1 hypothetical protein RNA01_12160 [Ciceribacter naphthalenivorans]GLR24820.1 hypothetical protein GCM10007920_46140 [Ciceribacter naphthalenivorans]GLT07676.1 hypothetical protein GCM10007926_46140 [Sphingomonas psychrolutea]
MNRTWWLALQITKRLWFRATLFAIMAVVTAVVGIAVGPYIPDRLSDLIGAKAVDAILTILASSMLAVTTFSLSTLVSATTAAASSGTPRAVSLILEDGTAQTALSTFLGAFLFSLVGLIALNAGLYGGGGRLVLFAATLAVVLLIVTMLLRWIDHLAGLGNVGETIRRAAEKAADGMALNSERPALGGRVLDGVPQDAVPLYHDQVGYIRHLDMGRLQRLAEGLEAKLHVTQRPGDFCSLARPVLYVEAAAGFGDDPEATRAALGNAFTVGDSRSYDQDPLLGLTVLSEVASRALSPGINDPGTAIDVVTQVTRLLSRTAMPADAASKKEGDVAEPEYPRVFVRTIDPATFVDVAFLAISRDGAGLIEVVLAVQTALDALAASSDPALSGAALAMAETACKRGLATLAFEDDRRRLEAVRLSSDLRQSMG